VTRRKWPADSPDQPLSEEWKAAFDSLWLTCQPPMDAPPCLEPGVVLIARVTGVALARNRANVDNRLVDSWPPRSEVPELNLHPTGNQDLARKILIFKRSG